MFHPLLEFSTDTALKCKHRPPDSTDFWWFLPSYSDWTEWQPPALAFQLESPLFWLLYRSIGKSAAKATHAKTVVNSQEMLLLAHVLIVKVGTLFFCWSWGRRYEKWRWTNLTAGPRPCESMNAYCDTPKRAYLESRADAASTSHMMRTEDATKLW